MNRVHILDCTLRDGGYCNQWKFGWDNARKIVKGLVKADIDIIECGFLSEKISYDKDVTKFTTVEELRSIIPENRSNKLFVAMINYGDYDAENLPQCDGTSIDGIRVAFHKKDMDEALKLCSAIKNKGYKVFIQAMVTLSYTDNEFLTLIKEVNLMEPYAFYIVDSFGMMKNRDLIRLFYMVEHNLSEQIWIGFHSHNNMQLAYSNAQTLTELQTSRSLIIDSSVYGMGRGAGNLNTELFVEYLNENYGSAYVLKPLLNIIDEILNGFYQRNYWGYSLPNYLSAKHNAHPNYASYLDDKKTLTVEDMNEIFESMDSDKRVEFDKNYIETLYLKYMERGQVQELHRSELAERLKGKRVLVIAPGRSSVDESEKILETAELNDVISVSVNFKYSETETDFIFLSNLRRFREIGGSLKDKYIITSNLSEDDVYLKTEYSALLNDTEAVRDNAGLMCIKFFIDLGVKNIILAGFDGYSHDTSENYARQKMELITKKSVLDAMNTGMSHVLSIYSSMAEIEFLTAPKYLKLS